MNAGPSPAVRVLGAAIGLLLLLPTLVVVPMSLSQADLLGFPPTDPGLRWYRSFFGDPMWMSALFESLRIALFTTVLSVLLGVPTALGIVRGRFRGRGAVQALVLSPMIMPLAVLAVGLFFAFSGWRILGSVGALVLAHTLVAYPLVYIAVSTSLRGVDARLEQASAGLGAGRWTTFRRVTLPLIAPGVATGGLFAFTTSWDELILSIFLAGPTVKTLPVRMWEQVQTELSPALAVAATLVMVVTVVVLLVAGLFLSRTRRSAR